MAAQLYDLVILGNGILGYTVALRLKLKAPSLKIAVVGPENRLGSASAAAGAMLASFAELEKGVFDCQHSEYKFRLSRESAALWYDWAAQLSEFAAPDDKLEIKHGTYVLHNTRADELDDESFEAIIDGLKRENEPHELLENTLVEGLAPSVESRPLKICYIPREGVVRPSHVFRLIEAGLNKLGKVDIHHAFAQGLKVESGGIKTVTLDNGTQLQAPKLLIAAGAESQRFFDQLPDIAPRIPRLFFGVGAALLLKTPGLAPREVVRTANRGLACGVHVVPYDKDYCYMGASNFISPVPEYSPRMTSLYALVQSAIEQVNSGFYKAQVEKIHVGHRPTTADTYPLIGELSEKDIFVLSGTKRDGIHMSPLYSLDMADRILGGKGKINEWFLPERKIIKTMTKEEGLKKAVAHLKSAAYQHELRLPKAGWEPMLEDLLRRRAMEAYDAAGITDFGIPPELLDMYKYGHIRAEN